MIYKKLDSSDVYKIVEEVCDIRNMYDYQSVGSKPDQCISADDKTINEDITKNTAKIDNVNSNQLIDQKIIVSKELYLNEPLVIYPSIINDNDSSKATATNLNTEQ